MMAFAARFLFRSASPGAHLGRRCAFALTATASAAVIGGSSSPVTCASTFGGTEPVLSGWTLRYFPAPGANGEVVRLLLSLSGSEWHDDLIPGSTKWPALKPTAKYLQLPLLSNADGKLLSQSQAMARYLAKGIKVQGSRLYPEDAWLAFQVDEFVDAIYEIREKNIPPTLTIKDQKEKEAARAALFATDGSGKIFEGLKRVEAQICGNDGYMVGGRLTLADLWVFATIQGFRSGFIDGIPTASAAWLDELPKLKAVVCNVGAQPAIQAYLAKKAEGGSKIYANMASPSLAL